MEGGFGWWCESNDATAFGSAVTAALQADLPPMGENAYAYLNENYTASKACEDIMKNR